MPAAAEGGGTPEPRKNRVWSPSRGPIDGTACLSSYRLLSPPDREFMRTLLAWSRSRKHLAVEVPGSNNRLHHAWTWMRYHEYGSIWLSSCWALCHVGRGGRGGVPDPYARPLVWRFSRILLTSAREAVPKTLLPGLFPWCETPGNSPGFRLLHPVSVVRIGVPVRCVCA